MDEHVFNWTASRDQDSELRPKKQRTLMGKGKQSLNTIRTILVMVQSKYPQGIVREIYHRKPDWWARWTWPMVLGIAVWTAVGAENIFNRWTQKVPISSSESTKRNGSTAEKSQMSGSESFRWELRPFLQRALMSATILGFGTGLGILFLSGRSRIVRRLHGVSNPTPVHHIKTGKVTSPRDLRYIVVETLGTTSPGKGKVFPMEKCELIPGRDDSEMRLKVEENSKFWLGLKGAQIEGTSVPGGSSAVRERLLKIFGQSKGTGRWRSGPIVEGRS